MNRKILSGVMSFVAITSLLAGCGSEQSTNPSNIAGGVATQAVDNSESNTETIDSDESVTIRMIESLTSPERTALLQKFADQFHDENPNITIELISPPLENADTKIAQMLQAKHPLDILEVREQTIQQFINNAWIADMSQYLKNWDEWDTLTETTKNYIYRYENRAYFIPYGFYQRALFYRKDWFDEAGLNPPTSWNEILETGKQLTDTSNNRYGWTFRGGSGGYFYLEMLLWSYVGYDKLADPYTGSYFLKDTDGQTIFTTDEAKQALEFYEQLYDEASPKDSIQWGFSEMVQGFVGGTTGMIIQDPEVIATFSSDMSEGSWGYTTMPVGPTGQAVFPNSPAGWGLTSYSEHPDEAMAFIKYLSSAQINTEFAKQYSTIPIHSTAPEIDDYFKTGPFSVYMEMAAEPDKYVFAQSPNTYEAYSEWHNNIDQTIQKYLSGSITEDDFLNYCDDYWSKAYKDEGRKW